MPDSSQAVVGGLTGSGKLSEVSRILDILREDAGSRSLQPDTIDKILDQLKIYGRDPKDCDPMFTKDGISTIAQYAFRSSTTTNCHNALRCLANAMLLIPQTRQIFVDLHYESIACGRLKSASADDEFLVSRVLFFTTYDTTISLGSLIEQEGLAETICMNIAKHAGNRKINVFRELQAKPNPMEDMALIETLKLMFNVTHFCPQHVEKFAPAVPHILSLLAERELAGTRPLEAPISSLVNSLININFYNEGEARAAMFPAEDGTLNVKRLLQILEIGVRSYGETEIDQQVLPVITLLRNVHEAAPEASKIIIRISLLPAESERSEPLGRTQTLPSILLRLSTSAVASSTREILSSFFFDMSDRDPRILINNVGYGFASGYLFSHNITIPEVVLDTQETGNTGKPVNPITGQNLEAEAEAQGPELTTEEKEREAERLVVLFERLRANGVISVENPMATAQREGRFEELDSDNDSE